MPKPIPLTILLILSALPHALATTTNTTTPTWHFRRYSDPDCQNEILNETGDTQIFCNDTPAQLQSYRFSATSDPDTGGTFGLRLYVEKECFVPASIYDGTEDGVGECRAAVPSLSWNTFPW